MNKNVLRRGLATLLVSGWALAPLQSAGRDEPWFSHHFEIGADFLYLTRSQFPRHPLVVDTELPDVSSVISTHKLGQRMHFEPGVNLYAVGGWGHSNLQASATFLTNDWSSTMRYVDPGSLDYPFTDLETTCDFYQADQASATYTATYQEGALTYLHDVANRHCGSFFFQWLLGARFFNLRETVQTVFVKSGEEGLYKTHTKNRLYGGEVGFVLGFDFARHWDWEVTLKGGYYGNHAEAEGFLSDCGGSVLDWSFVHEKWVGSGALSGAASVSYRPFSHCELRIGYEGLGLWGLALAPINLSSKAASPPSQIRTSTHELISGLLAGINFYF